MSAIPFSNLDGADLIIDQVYLGGGSGNSGDDPINILVPGVGNQGGFRPKNPKKDSFGNLPRMVLYTSGAEPEWPDTLDIHSGMFTYYGDNRRAGLELHGPVGNKMLNTIYEWTEHAETRCNIPPILVFAKAGTGRAVAFRGIAVPGAVGVPREDWLIAIWRSLEGQRFQNYRALFTILDEPSVSSKWLKIKEKTEEYWDECPAAWVDWVKSGQIRPLLAQRIGPRGKVEQLPRDRIGLVLLQDIHSYFVNNPYAFESCAVDIWKRLAPNTGQVNLTRPWRDGGRDAIGSYMFGPTSDRLFVDFALEAKCYKIDHGVGVKDMSRLISRLQHRQFGVFVTTSYFTDQTYKEVRDDRHPVVMISGGDILDVLRKSGICTRKEVETWLRQF